MKNIILGITGSIAAYRGAELANLLTKDGCGVHVIMTEGARKFVTPLTFQTLTRNKVYTDLFDESFYEDVRHISLAQKADLAVVAPASANCLGKIAAGIADDMLTTVIMALGGKPVLLCPAMNTAMYENALVQENIKKLTGLGYRFVPPREARLACGDLGKGALADIQDIAEAVKALI
ncbi:MAG: phosphopantothenoylcysteine decarboxylase [Spirochaetaceae bacterium]|nr:phosphopantothenoylcysteine decarboxylase [Spirochaetaceae bacterium]